MLIDAGTREIRRISTVIEHQTIKWFFEAAARYVKGRDQQVADCLEVIERPE